MTDISSYIEAHLDDAIGELRDYVALPSVSAQGQSIPETAAFVKALLESVGATVQVLDKESPGHPVVVGELPGASSKTLLLYNHYDVQPPEPLDLWTSPPFELRRDGDTLYGRPSELIGRQALHAARLGFTLASTGEWREFEAPIPADISQAIETLRVRHGVEPSTRPDTTRGRSDSRQGDTVSTS